MDVILLPGGVLRASVWDPDHRDTTMRDVSDDLPYFLRSGVRLHDEVTLRDLLMLAERHRGFLLPLFTDLLDDFVDEVKRPASGDELCDLDYLEICWECYSEGKRFDLQPALVGRNHEDPQVYSVEAVPTNAMGHLSVLLRTDFMLRLPTVRPARGEIVAADEANLPVRRELRRDFLLFDVFDAVMAEITVHGDPMERDRWWREIGRRELDRTEGADEE